MPTDEDRAFVEKVRTVGFRRTFKPGATRTVDVVNEDTGRKAGEHVEHYDGSQDARAMPEPLRLELRVKKGGPDG